MIIQQASPKALAYLAARTGLSTTGEFVGLSAVDAAGRLRGVAGYDKWTLNAARLHLLILGPCRELYTEMFRYPFVIAEKNVLVAEIAESNQRSRKLAVHLGFHELARIADGWAVGDDTIIYTLRRANCKFLKEEDRHELR